MKPHLLVVVLALAGPVRLAAKEPVDLDMMTRIRDEGFHHSQVMETAATLTDTIGPRLTGSPAQRRASEWTRKRLQEWGLVDARLEPWGNFGRGWSFDRAVVSVVAPEQAPLLALPRAWTPGTNGPKRGRALRVTLESEAVTSLVMAATQYNRILRLLDGKTEVEVEVDVAASFHDEDLTAANTLAEIPGAAGKREVVMLGAHLDSWHTGTGATDNAAGVAVVMEAARILKTIGARPRRTIRIALWTGEEPGLLGSRAYVAAHFASRPEPEDPAERDLPSALRRDQGPLTLKPDHARLSAYFNLDNGTGRIRGIYLQENAAVAPVFEAWFHPFADLGAGTLSQRNTGSTDHVPFDRAGLPGFQFIQDDDRATTDFEIFGTHHTNMDTYDRLQREDLMQASVIMAAFVWNAANREALLPRKPLPRP